MISITLVTIFFYYNAFKSRLGRKGLKQKLNLLTNVAKVTFLHIVACS